jgi:predicted enzyme related to lactoylglutathione lyase
MSTRTQPWPEGTPCWVDLAATDQQAAITFYSTVFGWSVQDSGEDMGRYGMATYGGQFAAGIGQAPADQPGPPAWTTYLASDDADKTCEAITSAGGTVVVPAMDVGGAGRMAIAQDPTGAFFGVWQAGEVIGATIVNEPGGIAWNECRTRDPQRAMEFYAAVFGFTYKAMEGGDPYWTIDGAGPGDTVGGITQLDESTPEQVPAHWLTYFSVVDADATANTAAGAGGTVHVPPFDTPFGRMAVIGDPQGAMFSVAGAPPEPAAEG